MIPILVSALPRSGGVVSLLSTAIVRNAVTALFTVDPTLVRVSGFGFKPLAAIAALAAVVAAHDFAGIRTAAVISIGTATLAAFTAPVV